ncbi:PAS domain S-box-containing protein/diguanylate cyclase (GGDEF)-like protein [Streptohalobacillus salinus]|uniref:PAS domain S-box-containing protein/diguanylate cyclase (GGDEF)-like protein n=1 Tax=Streptohalobacillus salinus TaxID=621096 RepID=A0A2V3W5Y5_9BACI|nr:EAL domain-containing protein [Streptohalobacillus salinus]PXW89006.1 PAS domain S-box-containing protein/diguanylate cyclase (GGDEF)-like protein [Streptohalobacillus salinus]
MTLNAMTELFNQKTLSETLAQFTDNIDLKQKLETVIDSYIKSQVFTVDALNETVSRAFHTLMIDKEGYITYIDKDFCEKLGYEEEDLLNHHYRILHAGVHDDQFYNDLWQSLQKGNWWQGDICTSSKDNEVFWYRTTILPMQNESDEKTQFVVFRTDITDVKRNDKRIIEQLDDDYRKVLGQLMNLTFRIHQDKETHAYQFRLFEGKLVRKLSGSHETFVTPEAVFFNDEKELLDVHFTQAFGGESVSFKHQYQDAVLYTTLTPIFEGDMVIEVVGSSSDVTSLEEAKHKARRLTYYDSLTELPNRNKFREDLKATVHHHREGQFAVAFLDIDRLKYINDSLGETIGDQVIDVISKRIDTCLSGKGTLYRYGGDEFALLIHAENSTIARLADKILKDIKQPIVIQGHEFFVTASIGISEYNQDAFNVHELVKHASVAVHYGKVNGRNARLFYTEQMNEDYHEVLVLDADIRKALQRNEFELYYQPQIDVTSGDVIGLEALIRWHHPKKGPISPAKFIPLAEESGVITQIGEWVINEACRQHREWVNQGFVPIRIAVNVSAIELQRVDFADQVAEIMHQTKMDPRYLEIEITENSVMQNTEDCIQTMNTLKQMGISLSIDDFGTGYSSFGYLKQFPIQYLKIDQSFIRSALKEQSSAAIVKAMIQLAHNFGLKVIAEGVEDKDILHLLQLESCDYYQGYYFSRPVAAQVVQDNVLKRKIN